MTKVMHWHNLLRHFMESQQAMAVQVPVLVRMQ
jgi:hypothetical protein